MMRIMRIESLHRVQPETVALMMQALGTNLPRPVREVPYPVYEEPLIPAVKQIPAIAAYEQRERQPNYIDEYA